MSLFLCIIGLLTVLDADLRSCLRAELHLAELSKQAYVGQRGAKIALGCRGSKIPFTDSLSVQVLDLRSFQTRTSFKRNLETDCAAKLKLVSIDASMQGVE
ncbi:hypothetical protein B0T10DRAFT_464157 [Thelonectria olida]|uniref:Uncharacterized protein n=1 Tax=Thelonectria olida TaxID=1576542 RepID=A0A9P9AKZ4_9HYPO|nr:hypothetical protein B0T10DRAFT_464157 [Thelonectria olida]